MSKYFFNSFHATDLLLYFPKTSEKKKFSDMKWFKRQICNPVDKQPKLYVYMTFK